MKITYLKANCVFFPLTAGHHVAIISKRDIKSGEELFVPYGIPYWRNHNKLK